MTTPQEQYDNVCKGRWNTIEKLLVSIDEKFDDRFDRLEDNLFHDNGGECHQSRLNRMDDWIKTHAKIHSGKTKFVYWLIPLCFTVALFIADVLIKLKISAQ